MKKYLLIAAMFFVGATSCSKGEFGAKTDNLKPEKPDCPSDGVTGISSVDGLQPETQFANVQSAINGAVGKAKFDFTFVGMSSEFVNGNDFSLEFAVHSSDFMNIQVSVAPPVKSKKHCSLLDVTLSLTMDYKGAVAQTVVNYKNQQFNFKFKSKADGAEQAKAMNTEITLYDNTDPRFTNLPAGEFPQPDKVCKATDGYPCSNSAN